MMDFPLSAIGPDGKLWSVLVTPDGKLVTDASPLPGTVLPLALGAIRVNASGEVTL